MREGVWVGYAQAGKHGALLALHRLGIGIVLVVATQQVQDAVDDQMAQMIRQALALGLWPAASAS